MKKFSILPLIAALAFFVSCQKQQTEEEKKAEVERQVQDRLAAERQADEKQRLAQQQADLEAREKALAEREAAEQMCRRRKSKRRSRRHRKRRSRSKRCKELAKWKRVPRLLTGCSIAGWSRMGDWRETSDYGFVWQPREAEDRNWRPYTDGRWVYTDAGWTWVSEEPFGWATYHYGRWVRLRRVGWVWVPGDEWAPAWVSWRTSKDYVGWAPLPPEARFDRRSGIRNWADNHYDIGPDQYCFVRNEEFGSERIRHSVVPVERNVTIVIETTNVTNITFSNTTVVNQGPNFEEMRSRSRRPIERYRLERQLNAETTAPAAVRGEVLVMSAPALSTDQGIKRPQRIKETIAQTTVEKSWSAETDRSAADRARAKMKAESTPPPDAPPKTFVKPPDSSAPTTATAAPGEREPCAGPEANSVGYTSIGSDRADDACAGSGPIAQAVSNGSGDTQANVADRSSDSANDSCRAVHSDAGIAGATSQHEGNYPCAVDAACRGFAVRPFAATGASVQAVACLDRSAGGTHCDRRTASPHRTHTTECAGNSSKSDSAG